MANGIKPTSSSSNHNLQLMGPLKESTIALQLPSSGGLLQKGRQGGWGHFFFIITFRWVAAYFTSLKARSQIIQQLLDLFDEDQKSPIKSALSKLTFEKLHYFKAMLPYIDKNAQADVIQDYIKNLDEDPKKTFKVVKLLSISRQALNLPVSNAAQIQTWMLEMPSSDWFTHFINLLRQALEKKPWSQADLSLLKAGPEMTEDVALFIDQLAHFSGRET